MALHIQMSEKVERMLHRESLKNKLSSVIACVLFMLISSGVLCFTVEYIVGDTPASFMAYIPPVEDELPTYSVHPRESRLSLVSRSSSELPPTYLFRNPIAFSLVPVEMDMSEGLPPISLVFDFGFECNFGEELGGDTTPMGNNPGSGSALVGTFYDLKQSGRGRGRKPSALALKKGDGTLSIQRDKYYEAIANFVNKGWSTGQLSRYFESPQKLHASCFYLPSARARYAPIAYQIGDAGKPENQWVCQPSGWCVVYRGKVRAPKTGKFRFIGTGDDYIGVRFNRKLVLSAGYRLFTHYNAKSKGGAKFALSETAARESFLRDVRAGLDPEHKGYELISTVPGCERWNRELGGLMAGREFSVKEGEVYPIEIILAEEGGYFGCVLFIEDVTDGKNSQARQYDIFRTNFAAPDAKEVSRMLQEAGSYDGDPAKAEAIPYNEDSYIWVAVP